MLLALAAMFLALWRPHLLAADPTRRHATVVLSALLLYVIVLHMLRTPLQRYNIPFKPLELALALVIVQALWVRLCRGPGTARRQLDTRQASPGDETPRIDDGAESFNAEVERLTARAK